MSDSTSLDIYTLKSQLQADLNSLTHDWAQLEVATKERRDRIFKIDYDVAQLNQQRAAVEAEICRNEGAQAYNQMYANRVKTRLAELEQAIAASATTATLTQS